MIELTKTRGNVYFMQIYVSINAGISALFLSKKKFFFSDLFCGSRTCRFEASLLHHIHVEGVAKYFVGQLDKARYYFFFKF